MLGQWHGVLLRHMNVHVGRHGHGHMGLHDAVRNGPQLDARTRRAFGGIEVPIHGRYVRGG